MWRALNPWSRAGLALSAAVGAAALGNAAYAQAAPAVCARAEFEAVVDDAGTVLREMTQKNSATFQAKLRALKVKRNWTQDQFVAEGTRFVQNEKIASLDETSARLLDAINRSDGANGSEPHDDCAHLTTMKADLTALVAVQNEKWSYMFATIDAELTK